MIERVGMISSDALYHELFSHPILVAELIDGFLPDLAGLGLDYGAMRRISTKFFTEREGRKREGDIIWCLPTQAGPPVYLYLLLEFQSSNDWWMALRAQIYQGLLWQHLVAEQALRPGERLPPLFLVVLYNGEDRWTGACNLAELIDLPPASPLWAWQPQARYHLLDMTRQPVAMADSLAALLFRLEQSPQPPELADLVGAVIAWFRRHPDYAMLRRLFADMIRHSIRAVQPDLAVPEELQEVRSMLMTLGERWVAQWLAEGKAEGMVAGEATALCRLLVRRFGPLPAVRLAQIGAADLPQLELWLDRVLEGASLEDVLGPLA